MTDDFPYETNEKYSNCCGEKDRLMTGDCISYSEMNICPKCKDWCEFISKEEMENEK